MNNTVNEDSVVTVDLLSNDWRDEHIDSLEAWHPDFHFVASDLNAIVEQYGEVMRKYREFLLTGGDPLDELFNHVTDEVFPWMYNKMEATVHDIWRKTEE